MLHPIIRFSLTFAALAALAASPAFAQGKALVEDSGALAALGPDGKEAGRCPLERTAVKAEISGFFASVDVTQTFRNPFPQKIEAVYTFPLPEGAAVHRMVMRIGERTVRGEIKRREEAKQIYEAARDRGQIASLLDEERPNVFTQRVANIEPGAAIEITISYLDVLPYKAGSFTFVFPTVVGPRYHPVGRVPDAANVTPPVTPRGTRAGHTIAIDVHVNAGVRIVNLKSELHEVTIDRRTDFEADVKLVDKAEIPNRDFALTYEVAEDAVKSGVICHKPDGEEGYFTLVLIPPKRVEAQKAQPKEMIFVVDRSGSQSGLPIEKAKETLLYILDHMNPADTFQVIDFSNGYNKLFTRPMPFSEEMKAKARAYIETLDGDGGTEMAEAVKAACAEPAEDGRLRIVTLMTDGYIGNDYEIVKLVKDLRGKSRWFPFGTGNSVNRFLIDKVAAEGGGEAEYVLLNTPSEAVAKRFYDKIANPVLTDISIGVEGVKIDAVYPNEPTDLWDRAPIVLKGRYAAGGKGVVTLRGQSGGKPYEERIECLFPEREESNAAIRPIWARAKVDALMSRDWMVMHGGEGDADRKGLKEEIVQVALAHSLMTPFTSFVAVEETLKTEGGKPVRVDVPVEMPEGVSYDGIFGKEEAKRANFGGAVPQGGAHLKMSADAATGVMRETESLSAPGGAPALAPPAPSIAPAPMARSVSKAFRGGRHRRDFPGAEERDGVRIIYPDFGGKPGDKPAPPAGPAGLSDDLKAFLSDWKAGKVDEKAATLQVTIRFDGAIPAEAKKTIESLAARVVSTLKGRMTIRVHAKHLETLATLTGVKAIEREK